MNLLQIKIDDNLKKAIDEKADIYGVPTSSLVRIVLVKTFLGGDVNGAQPGNVFNADRDNGGKGLKIDDLISSL